MPNDATPADAGAAIIAAHRSAVKEALRLYRELDLAEAEAAKEFGHRPLRLIAWRHFSDIGEHGIEAAKVEFLRQPGADGEIIEKEYQAALGRYAATEYEGIAWDHRTGLTALRKRYEAAHRAERKAGAQMARTKPTTPHGAGALVSYVVTDIKDELTSWDWPLAALKTLAAALAQMTLQERDRAA
jgi:hypothetical protein